MSSWARWHAYRCRAIAVYENAVYLGQKGYSGDGFERTLASLPPADLQNILEKNGDAIKVMLDNFTKFLPT